MSHENLLYVYAVVPSDAAALEPLGSPPLTEGVVDGLRLVGHQGLTAVVRPVDSREFDEAPLRAHLEDLDWVAAVAGEHHTVVEAVGHRTTTVPLRLATVCRGEAGVRRLLDNGRHRLHEALERVAGHEEWGVKLYADPASPPPAPGPSASPPPAPDRTASTGRDFLRRRLESRKAREGDAVRASGTADGLHTLLSAHATGAVLHPPQQARLSHAPGRNVLNAAYLVPVGRRRAFLDAVPDRDTPFEGLRVVVTGPWVPYSFTQGGPEPTQGGPEATRTGPEPTPGGPEVAPGPGASR
ncbi:hypothetical protein GT204_16455 [Streptomyces sp. SID4919]|uniref:GvpL/GvpF family gas vesicle protein n=1 Tax=unclassified Streptomyces TaxID=2593676 RepID=UPI000823F451|nr:MULTISPECIES: GvpL/GvpF family gas vesicle protein [unclassified Streptomyces]MYY10454.1 hypothetical protein [Streptomyces sp. SID4919]SCK46584.1 Gas vesicle synthesis protein GvpL/GvpF [Streptomyces sp. AmelKG-E11A]